MNDPNSPFRDFARRLLALELDDPQSQPSVREAVNVIEKLRGSLTRLAGPDAFASLLRRALALTQSEDPAAHTLSINADGSLEGIDELAAGEHGSPNSGPVHGLDRGCETAVTIIAQLLGLLATFIGKSLTLRLVREAWPDASLDELQ